MLETEGWLPVGFCLLMFNRRKMLLVFHLLFENGKIRKRIKHKANIIKMKNTETLNNKRKLRIFDEKRRISIKMF